MKVKTLLNQFDEFIGSYIEIQNDDYERLLRATNKHTILTYYGNKEVKKYYLSTIDNKGVINIVIK